MVSEDVAGLPRIIGLDEIREGDRLRVHYSGLTIEGVAARQTWGTWLNAEGAVLAGAGDEQTIYLLERPPAKEPTNLGAVVEAGYGHYGRHLWVRGFGPEYCWYSDYCGWVPWSELVNPVVKHEGWPGG